MLKVFNFFIKYNKFDYIKLKKTNIIKHKYK